MAAFTRNGQVDMSDKTKVCEIVSIMMILMNDGVFQIAIHDYFFAKDEPLAKRPRV